MRHNNAKYSDNFDNLIISHKLSSLVKSKAINCQMYLISHLFFHKNFISFSGFDEERGTLFLYA